MEKMVGEHCDATLPQPRRYERHVTRSVRSGKITFVLEAIRSPFAPVVAPLDHELVPLLLNVSKHAVWVDDAAAEITDAGVGLVEYVRQASTRWQLPPPKRGFQ